MIQWKQGTEDDGLLKWELLRSNGTSAATVYGNGIWWTWDTDGISGENSSEDSIIQAKAEAILSALNQGFLP